MLCLFLKYQIILQKKTPPDLRCLLKNQNGGISHSHSPMTAVIYVMSRRPFEMGQALASSLPSIPLPHVLHLAYSAH